jgi:hypothetical protein
VKLGATVLDGLQGNVEIPVGRAALPVAWTPESGSATEGDPTVGSVSLSPKILSAQIAVSRQLLVQSPGVENWVKTEIGLALGTEIDRIALLGTGVGQPLGVLNTPSAQTITWGGPATWPNVLLMETLLGKANVIPETVGLVSSNNVRGKWKNVTKAGVGSTGFLWDIDNTVNNYPSIATSKLDVSNQAILGDWSECYLGSWGGDAINLVVDNITQAKVGKIVITATFFGDVVFRRPNLFVTSTDSGAQ